MTQCHSVHVRRVGIKECLRVGLKNGFRLDDGGTGGGPALGLLYAGWWWARGVPEDWIDPDNPRRLRF